MAPESLVLVRHVSTSLSESSVLQGTLDPPLSAKGLTELPRLIKKVEAVADGSCAILTSPLKRAVQTADGLAEALSSMHFLVADELRELNFGQWQGRPELALSENAAALRAYHKMDPNFIWGGGETLAQRSDAAVQRILGLWSDSGAAVCVAVSHGFLLQGVVSLMIHGTAARAREYMLETGAVVLLHAGPKGWVSSHVPG